MTESVNKDLVRRYYEEIVSGGDIARIEEFIGFDYVEVYQNKRYGAANMLEALLAIGAVEIVKRQRLLPRSAGEKASEGRMRGS